MSSYQHLSQKKPQNPLKMIFRAWPESPPDTRAFLSGVTFRQWTAPTLSAPYPYTHSPPLSMSNASIFPSPHPVTTRFESPTTSPQKTASVAYIVSVGVSCWPAPFRRSKSLSVLSAEPVTIWPALLTVSMLTEPPWA